MIKTGQRHDASLPQIAMAKEAAQDLSRSLESGRVVLRRDKQIISHLLPKKKDHIVFCPLTSLQKRCYSRVIKSGDVVAIRKSEHSEPGAALYYMSKLTQLSSHLALMRGASGQGMASENDENFLDLAFGEDMEEIQQLMKSPHVDDLCELSGKLRVVMKLLPVWKKEGHKVLLFSQSTRMLDIFEQVLSLHRYKFCRLDGTVSVTQRQRIADNFNNDPRMFVFLLSTKAAGLGLNLVSANVVVVFDPSWNQVSFFLLSPFFTSLNIFFTLFTTQKTWDLQAQDRAYRIGQTKDTMVFRLISEKTIEEKQYQRQIYKQQLDNVGLQNRDQKR